MKNNADKFGSKILRDIGPYLNLGWQLIITILIFVLIGYFLDIWLNTKPVLLIIFSLLGCFVGMFDFIRSVLKKR